MIFSRWVIDKMERWLTQYLYYFLNHCRVNCGSLFFALHINFPNLCILVTENIAMAMWYRSIYIWNKSLGKDKWPTRSRKKKNFQNYYINTGRKNFFFFLLILQNYTWNHLARTSWQNEGKNKRMACNHYPPLPQWDPRQQRLLLSSLIL